MTAIRPRSFMRAVAQTCIFLFCFLLPAIWAGAQVNPAVSAQLDASAVQGIVPALFLSDIHFEPFWDPAKAPQLAAAPVGEWKAILTAPPSVDREQRFQALEKNCHVRGDDTSPALLDASLQAVRKQAAGAAFATVSGDLIAHAFSCKFDAVFPHAPAGAYRAFVEKTIAYVFQELGSSLPGVPLFVALGNNDSDCGDYRLDAHGAFLSDTAAEFTQGFPATEQRSAQQTFVAGGYYSVSLPAPLHNARLLVLNDLFMSGKYATCAGRPDPRAADEQLAWLRQQLDEARRNGEKVWVMGHIPPGVDLHETMTKMRDVCGGEAPQMFLGSEKMADELAGFGDVIQLAIFAHTHMDEMRILQPEDGVRGPGKSVALKIVPSISPINGNAPAFTLAEVDAVSAGLKDYRVFVASNRTGIDAVWKEEYDFGRRYHAAEFSAVSARKLIAGFLTGMGANSEARSAYIQSFMPGSASSLLGLVWPQYVCSLAHYSGAGYRSCACPSAASLRKD